MVNGNNQIESKSSQKLLQSILVNLQAPITVILMIIDH
jgi:short-subunit dehydrogenase involved in D-alanine esterification of teichoic acids